jgi:hypothetical protein
VAWALNHTIALNPGGIGGPPRLASLERVGGQWKANEIDAGEIADQVDDLERHIAKYRDDLMQKVAAPVEPVPKP